MSQKITSQTTIAELIAMARQFNVPEVKLTSDLDLRDFSVLATFQECEDITLFTAVVAEKDSQRSRVLELLDAETEEEAIAKINQLIGHATDGEFLINRLCAGGADRNLPSAIAEIERLESEIESLQTVNEDFRLLAIERDKLLTALGLNPQHSEAIADGLKTIADLTAKAKRLEQMEERSKERMHETVALQASLALERMRNQQKETEIARQREENEQMERAISELKARQPVQPDPMATLAGLGDKLRAIADNLKELEDQRKHSQRVEQQEAAKQQPGGLLHGDYPRR